MKITVKKEVIKLVEEFLKVMADILFNQPPSWSSKNFFEKVSKKDYEENVGKVTSLILQAQFKENTGTHFLDSGGACGRRYQALEGKDLDELPRMNVKVESYGSEPELIVSKSAYHFLKEHLVYALEMDRMFLSFCEQDKTFVVGEKSFNPKKKAWYECIPFWLAYIRDQLEVDVIIKNTNTYNYENALDCVLQFSVFEITEGKHEGEYIILQTHNGCDVRGGYSTPHVYSFQDDFDYFSCEMDDMTARCPNHSWTPKKEKTTQLDLEGNVVPDLDHVNCYSDDCGYHWYADSGEALEKGMDFLEVDGEVKAVCKKCKEPLEFY